MYNERCTRERGPLTGDPRGLRLVNSVEVPFPYFAFAQHGHLQQQFFVSVSRRAYRFRVCLARGGSDRATFVDARV